MTDASLPARVARLEAGADARLAEAESELAWLRNQLGRVEAHGERLETAVRVLAGLEASTVTQDSIHFILDPAPTPHPAEPVEVSDTVADTLKALRLAASVARSAGQEGLGRDVDAAADVFGRLARSSAEQQKPPADGLVEQMAEALAGIEDDAYGFITDALADIQEGGPGAGLQKWRAVIEASLTYKRERAKEGGDV